MPSETLTSELQVQSESGGGREGVGEGGKEWGREGRSGGGREGVGGGEREVGVQERQNMLEERDILLQETDSLNKLDPYFCNVINLLLW